MIRHLIVPCCLTLIHSAATLTIMGHCMTLQPIPGIIGITLWLWLGLAAWINLYCHVSANCPSNIKP